MSANGDEETRRLERIRRRVQKKAAKRRTRQKAKRNKKQREREKRKRRIERREPEGARERAAVAKAETKDLASEVKELAETAPGAKTVKRLAKGGAAVASAAASKAGAAGEGKGGASLRERFQGRASSKPIQLETGYEQVNGEMLGYYQPGEGGQKFYYVPGNEPSRRQAKQSARELLPEPGRRGGGKPSMGELAGQAAVSESFLSLGTRAEYDPAPPVRQNPDELQPRASFGFGPGMGGGLGFNWAGEGERAGGERQNEAVDFVWGGDAEEGADNAGWNMGFDWNDGRDGEGVNFEW